jgi:hypothetical protein
MNGAAGTTRFSRTIFGDSMKMPEPLFQPRLSRRGLLAGVGTVAAMAAAGTRLAMPQGWAAPVVSFHADAPYLDPTGRADPLHTRIATDWAIGLDQEALLRLGQIF